MVKNIGLAVAAALALSVSYSASAAYGVPEQAPAPVPAPTTDQWYVTGSGGVAFTPDVSTSKGNLQYELGFDISGAVGYKMDSCRYEVQYIFQRTDHKSLAKVNNTGRTEVNSALANVYYDFGYDEARPFLFIGAGWANIKASGGVATSSSKDDEFAYQGGGGVNFDLGNDLTGFLSAAYFGTTKANKQLGDRYQNVLFNAGVTAYMDV